MIRQWLTVSFKILLLDTVSLLTFHIKLKFNFNTFKYDIGFTLNLCVNFERFNFLYYFILKNILYLTMFHVFFFWSLLLIIIVIFFLHLFLNILLVLFSTNVNVMPFYIFICSYWLYIGINAKYQCLFCIDEIMIYKCQ